MAKRTTRRTGRSTRQQPRAFYSVSLPEENVTSPFYFEYTVITKTVDAVNSFNSLYRWWRKGSAGGPSTHDQQDLYRAMLVFACAGLDVFVKQLVKAKLPPLMPFDEVVQAKFKEFVKRGLKKDEKAILNTVALALVDRNPRAVFLNEYIESLTGDSLQSTRQLYMVAEASGLDTKLILGPERTKALDGAFAVRNQIVHEMDITALDKRSKTPGHRTRYQRRAPEMERHTRAVLDLAQDLFTAYKGKHTEFNIGVEKAEKVSEK